MPQGGRSFLGGIMYLCVNMRDAGYTQTVVVGVRVHSLSDAAGAIRQTSSATTAGALLAPVLRGMLMYSGRPQGASQAILAPLRVLLAVGYAPLGLAGWCPCAPARAAGKLSGLRGFGYRCLGLSWSSRPVWCLGLSCGRSRTSSGRRTPGLTRPGRGG